LIAPYRVEEITDAMKAIANDTELRSHVSQLGLARAIQFSWEKTGKNRRGFAAIFVVKASG
jgi:glycosyltransferase involved in cell wall biosynthesis